MTEEKIRYKDWRLFHKVFVPINYGLIAIGAIMTAYNIKHHKDPVGPILATIGATFITPLCHLEAKDDARLIREEKNKQRN